MSMSIRAHPQQKYGCMTAQWREVLGFQLRNLERFNVWCAKSALHLRRRGMHSLPQESDVRVMNVSVNDSRLIVDLMDGRTIAVPLAWYPRLANASAEQRSQWELAGGGYGIHWPLIDEDLSAEGLLRGARAPLPLG